MKKKALAINFGGLGDQILFLPSLAILRKFFAQDEIFFITESRAKSVAKLTKLLDKKNIIAFDYKEGNKVQKALELINLIKAGNYTHVFSTGSAFYVPVILFLSGVKNRFSIHKADLAKHKNSYAAELLFQCLKGFCDEAFIKPQIDLIDGSELSPDIKKIFDQDKSKKPLLGIHPGVSTLSNKLDQKKQWTAKAWSQLIDKLISSNEHQVILFGGPDDEKICQEITRNLSSQKGLLDLSNKTKDPAELAYCFSKLQHLICHDSAPMHIASCLGLETSALFSSTDHKRLIPADAKHMHPIYAVQNSQGAYDWVQEEILKSLKTC